MNIIERLLSYKKQYTTYSIGLLQAKSYRILKKRTNSFLAAYDLTTVDFALLGILLDTEDTVTLSELADALGVKAPFVTRLIKKLQVRSLVVITPSQNDTRAKDIKLTKEGKKLVVLVEKRLRQVSKSWIKGVSPRDLISYVKVLKAISRFDDTQN